MTRLMMVALFLLGGCVHQAQVKGINSNPSARVDAATFSHVADDVIVDLQVGLGEPGDPNAPQILVRTQIPCREGAVPPPDGFRMVYVTFNPTTLSTFNVSQGYITVHRCEGPFLELSGGWYVEGIIATTLELQFQPANPKIPITHVEVLRVKANMVEPSAELR